MKERIVTSEQLRKPVNVPVTGLTPDINTLYAGKGVLFMGEVNMDDKTSSQKPGTEANKVERPQTAGSSAVIDVAPVHETGIEDDEILSYEQALLTWETPQATPGEKKSAEVDEKVGSQVSPELLAALGITKEVYQKNKKFYDEHNILFKGQPTKAEQETINELLKLWKKRLNKGEFRNKIKIVHALAVDGIGPDEFNSKYEWKAYFDTPFEDFQEKPGLVGSLARLFFQELANAGASEDEKEKLLHRRMVEVAKVLWSAHNERRKELGDRILPNEIPTQNYLASRGIAPDKRMSKDRQKPSVQEVFKHASLEDKDRIKSVRRDLEKRDLPENLEDVAALKEFDEAVLKAHHIGEGEAGKSGKTAGVYDYTFSQLRRKVEALRFGKTREEGLSVEEKKALSGNELTNAKERRLLMEAGYVGNGEDDEGKKEDKKKNRSARRAEKRAKKVSEEKPGELYKSIIDRMNRRMSGDRSFTREDDEKLREDIERFKEDFLGQVKTNEYDELMEKAIDKRPPPESPEEDPVELEQKWVEWEKSIGRALAPDELKEVLQLKQQGISPEKSLLGKTIVPQQTPEQLEAVKKQWQAYIAAAKLAGHDISEDDIQRIMEEAERGVSPFASALRRVLDENMGKGSIQGTPEQRQAKYDNEKKWNELRMGLADSGQLTEELSRKIDYAKNNNLPYEGTNLNEIVDTPSGPTDSVASFLAAQERRLIESKEGKSKKGFSDMTIYEQIQAGRKERTRLEATKVSLRSQGSGPEIEDAIQRINSRIAQLEANEEGAYEGLPKNLEDVAWQIGQTNQEMFGMEGKFPILEIFEKQTEKKIADPGENYDSNTMELRVNRANFIRWQRERMMYLHSDSPDSEIDFFSRVGITKTYRSVAIGEMTEHFGQYFRSAVKSRELDLIERSLKQKELDPTMRVKLEERKKELGQDIDEDLLNEVKREAWLFGVTRVYDIQHRLSMGNEDQLVQALVKMFTSNTFTKTVWGDRSSFYWIFTQDQDFMKQEGRPEGDPHDRKVGAAINTAYLTYYNLTDVAMLRHILGTDATILSRDKLMALRDKLAKIEKTDDEATKQQKRGAFNVTDAMINGLFYRDAKGNPIEGHEELKDSQGKTFEKINEKAFVDTMNLFKNPQTTSHVVTLVRNAIRQDIAKQHELYEPDNGGYREDPDNKGEYFIDGSNVTYAETFAFSMAGWTLAAARNNHTAAGFNAGSKIAYHTETYRSKQAGGDYGGAFGIPYNIHQFKFLATDLMTGIRTETKISTDDRARNPEVYGVRVDKAYKTPLEVLWEMHSAKGDPARFEQAAAQLVFPDNSMKQYALDDVQRAMKVFQDLTDAKAVDLEKFTKIDTWKGVTFDRGQFQKAISEDFLKPMRYLFRTWKNTDLSQMVRVSVGEETNVKWVEMPLAEAMFGHEMLNIPEFWKQVPPHTPGAIKIETRSKEGGWAETWRMPEQVDAKEVEGNRDQLYRQAAKVRLAAELFAHRDLHSNDPRYDFIYFETIIKALEQIPGGVLGDEFDMRASGADTDPKTRFFSKRDIEWIREKSNTTRFHLLRDAFFMSTLSGAWKGNVEALKKFIQLLQGDLK